VRQLCDQVLWLDQGQVRGLGQTESVLTAYETHVRIQDAGAKTSLHTSPAEDSSRVTVPDLNLVVGARRAGLLAARIVSMEPALGDELTLTGPDLQVQVQAVCVGDEMPSVGVMLEQFQGVGITSVATHAEGAVLAAIARHDGQTTWQVTLTFEQLPLHSGKYCLSFYLFDSQGLVVYDEWKDYLTFHWLSPSLTPGLVRLAHHWS
jgi:lipopolysaccharide transport system ATP-binding protein